MSVFKKHVRKIAVFLHCGKLETQRQPGCKISKHPRRRVSKTKKLQNVVSQPVSANDICLYVFVGRIFCNFSRAAFFVICLPVVFFVILYVSYFLYFCIFAYLYFFVCFLYFLFSACFFAGRMFFVLFFRISYIFVFVENMKKRSHFSRLAERYKFSASNCKPAKPTGNLFESTSETWSGYPTTTRGCSKRQGGQLTIPPISTLIKLQFP